MGMTLINGHIIMAIIQRPHGCMIPIMDIKDSTFILAGGNSLGLYKVNMDEARDIFTVNGDEVRDIFTVNMDEVRDIFNINKEELRWIFLE